MQTFIFDKYGYIVEDEYAKEFSYNKWKFKLEANQKDEMELFELNSFIMDLDNHLFKRGVRIIENREKRLISDSEFGQLSLVGVNEFNISFTDLLMMHREYQTYASNKPIVFLSSIKELWINKTDLIESKILPSLKIDNYAFEMINACIIYSLGLAETAISYLQDISLDYGDKVEEVTLTHKRFNEFNSYELLNPFNLIIDSPMRDIADLINIDIVNKDNIEQVLNSYNLSQKSASILLARVIYPSFLFDLLEEHYAIKKDIKKELIKYYSSIEERKKKIVFIHNYLTNRYGIRQVNWLLLK